MSSKPFKTRFISFVLTAVALLATGPRYGLADSTRQSPTVPFKLELQEVAPSKLPPLQSFTSASSGGKWLIFGGRTAGLHGFNPGKDNFPPTTQNTIAYVIDPVNNLVLGSVDLTASLPDKLYLPLISTNQESAQVGDNLFVLGGYGRNSKTTNMVTYGTLTKISVTGIINAIVANQPIAPFVTQSPSSDRRLMVTGGQLKFDGGIFYLVFGQSFNGFYSIENKDYNHAGGQFQKYTEKVRVFNLNSNLSVNQYKEFDGGYDPNLPYHRRDLNVVDTIQQDGITPGITAYGGVFLAGQVGGHTTPVDILPGATIANTTVTLESSFHQALNHYECATMTLYDSGSQSSLTTLFGGISQFHYDPVTNTLIQDTVDLTRGVDGLPFINSISTIQRGPNATFSQYIQPVTMPSLLGADAQFLLSPALMGTQVYPNGVINLSAISGRTLVGYLYGGIESGGPYSGLVTQQPPTWPSARLFQVYITPGPSPVTAMPPLPTHTTPYPPTS